MNLTKKIVAYAAAVGLTYQSVGPQAAFAETTSFSDMLPRLEQIIDGKRKPEVSIGTKKYNFNDENQTLLDKYKAATKDKKFLGWADQFTPKPFEQEVTGPDGEKYPTTLPLVPTTQMHFYKTDEKSKTEFDLVELYSIIVKDKKLHRAVYPKKVYIFEPQGVLDVTDLVSTTAPILDGVPDMITYINNATIVSKLKDKFQFYYAQKQTPEKIIPDKTELHKSDIETLFQFGNFATQNHNPELSSRIEYSGIEKRTKYFSFNPKSEMDCLYDIIVQQRIWSNWPSTTTVIINRKHIHDHDFSGEGYVAVQKKSGGIVEQIVFDTRESLKFFPNRCDES